MINTYIVIYYSRLGDTHYVVQTNENIAGYYEKQKRVPTSHNKPFLRMLQMLGIREEWESEANHDEAIHVKDVENGYVKYYQANT